MKKHARRIKQIPLDAIVDPEDISPDVVRNVILLRIRENLLETKHPFHHKTADGTIVDSDPTLLHLVSCLHDAPSAIPVNRRHYGFDLYADKSQE